MYLRRISLCFLSYVSCVHLESSSGVSACNEIYHLYIFDLAIPFSIIFTIHICMVRWGKNTQALVLSSSFALSALSQADDVAVGKANRRVLKESIQAMEGFFDHERPWIFSFVLRVETPRMKVKAIDKEIGHLVHEGIFE